jgi:hypothetical protein
MASGENGPHDAVAVVAVVVDRLARNAGGSLGSGLVSASGGAAAWRRRFLARRSGFGGSGGRPGHRNCSLIQAPNLLSA